MIDLKPLEGCGVSHDWFDKYHRVSVCGKDSLCVVCCKKDRDRWEKNSLTMILKDAEKDLNRCPGYLTEDIEIIHRRISGIKTRLMKLDN